MSDSADREKYGPLGEFLAALPPATNEITLAFDKVSQIIGDALPPSAFKYREWWANQEGGSRAPRWRAAGFKVDQVDRTKDCILMLKV